jgi:DNA-binding NtrC family response regulator
VLPTLLVFKLSDSFSAIWPELAAACDLRLEVTTSPADFDRHPNAVGVVAAGGHEHELEQQLRAILPCRIEVAAVGALASHRLAAAAIRAGASEFFALTEDYELLRSWLAEQAERIHARSRRHEFAAGERGKYKFDGILGQSPALLAALERAARIIPHRNVTVLVTGETGSGKELVARAVHYNGPRSEAPFVDINCAAIPEHLIESELFGHEKGAFTDASAQKPGLFEYAEGGTLFLDEVGHLPMTLQGKLLRALEERQVRRVGGTKNIPVDVRVISATNVNLLAAVRRGEFREDLYYRLNVVLIELPPLRGRRDDIVPLARHFLARFAAEYGVPQPVLTKAAERSLASRDWAGNVRELRNLIERAVLLGGGATLDVSDFESAPELVVERGTIPFPASLDTVVRATAVEMLTLCSGNKSLAARRLGISRTRLQRVLDGVPDEGNAPDDATMQRVP